MSEKTNYWTAQDLLLRGERGDRFVLASDYARMEQECERMKADRAACWAEFKLMTKACLEAEKERDAALKQVEGLRGALAEIKEKCDAFTDTETDMLWTQVDEIGDIAWCAIREKP